MLANAEAIMSPEAETSLDAWIAHNWRDTPGRLGRARRSAVLPGTARLSGDGTGQVRGAQEIASLRAEIVALRAENASLRGNQSAQARRLKQLEREVGLTGKLDDSGLYTALGTALREYTTGLVKWQRETDERLQALEQRPTGLQWEGTWAPEKAYPGSGVVIYDGGAWIALQPTCPGEKPGAGGPWRLFVRSNESELRKLIREELRKPRAA